MNYGELGDVVESEDKEQGNNDEAEGESNDDYEYEEESSEEDGDDNQEEDDDYNEEGEDETKDDTKVKMTYYTTDFADYRSGGILLLPVIINLAHGFCVIHFVLLNHNQYVFFLISSSTPKHNDWFAYILYL